MQKLKSRKLWVSVFSSALLAFIVYMKPDVDPAQLATIVGPAVAYILGESYIDGGKKK